MDGGRLDHCDVIGLLLGLSHCWAQLPEWLYVTGLCYEYMNISRESVLIRRYYAAFYPYTMKDILQIVAQPLQHLWLTTLQHHMYGIYIYIYIYI